MSYTVINPATGETVTEVEHLDIDATDRAIAQAARAQKE